MIRVLFFTTCAAWQLNFDGEPVKMLPLGEIDSFNDLINPV